MQASADLGALEGRLGDPQRLQAVLAPDQRRPAVLGRGQEIDQLESEADRVMRSAISELFRSETDVRELIKLKAVYEWLESATDKCQDVANVIESVVLENA